MEISCKLFCAIVTFWGLSYIIGDDGVSYIFGGRGLS